MPSGLLTGCILKLREASGLPSSIQVIEAFVG